MDRCRARRRKDEERDGKDDGADHHERQSRLRRRDPTPALLDLSLVVPLLEGAGEYDDDENAD